MSDDAILLRVPGEATCGFCGKPIPRNDAAFWVHEMGFYHPDCGEKMGYTADGPPLEELPDIPYTTMNLPADAKCAACDKPINRGEKGVWVRNMGIFHPICLGLPD